MYIKKKKKTILYPLDTILYCAEFINLVPGQKRDDAAIALYRTINTTLFVRCKRSLLRNRVNHSNAINVIRVYIIMFYHPHVRWATADATDLTTS